MVAAADHLGVGADARGVEERRPVDVGDVDPDGLARDDGVGGVLGGVQADVTGVDARSVLTGWIGAGHDVPEFTRELVEGVRDRLGELDGVIGAHAKGWQVGRMAALDRTILRVAVYELRYELNNRPDWVRIPVAGILRLLEGRVGTES